MYCKDVLDLAVCGNAATTYSSEEINFTGEFCQKGEVENEPIFPQKDSSVNWKCVNKLSSVNCNAQREVDTAEELVCGNYKAEKNEECDDGNTENGDGCDSLCKIEEEVFTDDPICGEAAKVYIQSEDQFSGDFCKAGVVVDEPDFPISGSSVSWSCEKDEKVVSCNSSREELIERKENNIIEDKKEEKEEENKEKEEDYQEEGVAYARTNIPLLPWLSVAGAIVGGILLIPFRISPLLGFIELFGLLTKRNKERFWGTVFEEETKMPIMAAKVVLMDTLGRELETVYSDKYGRYGFLAGAGKYVMDIYKPDSELRTNNSKDSIYGKLYTGKPFEIKDDDDIIMMSIAMKNNKIDWKEYANKKIKSHTSKFRIFKEYFFTFIHVVGFIYTAIVTFLFPNLWNIVMLSLYVIIFIIKLIIKKKKFGIVSTNDDKPVPFSIVNLYNKSTKKKEAFAITDVIGRYYLLAENGNYDIVVKGQPVSGKIFEKKGNVRVTGKLLRKNIRV